MSLLTSLPRSHFFGLVLALSLAVSSLNSKAMGLAWLLLVLAGAWAAVRHRGQGSKLTDFPWVQTWCLVATTALLVKSVPMLYWSDPWDERHGELRLFFGAWAVYGLTRWWRLERSILMGLAHALTLSSTLGLAWVIFFGRHQLTTHHIPWAGVMAMVSALLLALALKSDFAQGLRRLWLCGGVLALMAVLSSQSRGAYGIVLWWLLVGLHHVMLPGPRSAASTEALKPMSSWRKWAWVGAACLALLGLSQTPVIERPAQSLQDAVEEIRLSRSSMTEGANSSVGARLYMWQQSLNAISQAPVMGHGRDARKSLLQTWGQAAQSPEVQRLGHVHNEYLNQMVDHGLWGLASQLLYLTGLFWIGWQLLKRHQNTAAFSVAGIGFVHMTTSLSNVNFAHNYYTAAFSMLVGLSLWLTHLGKD
jgi:O-antigen ligase